MMQFIIMTVGLALRLWGVDYGLPELFHQDEPIIVNHAMMIAAKGDPGFYIIPPFTMFVLSGVYGFYFVIGRIFGLFSGADSFAMHFISDPGSFYLLGRIVLGTLPGIATVWLTMRIGTKYFSPFCGVFAGAVLAVCHLHVQHSHYIYADIPVTFAIMLIYLTVFRAMDSGRMRDYAIAGFVFGWAVSIKYTAFYFCVPLFFGYLILNRHTLNRFAVWKRAAAMMAASFVSFIVFVPYFIFRNKEFMGQIHKQSGAEVDVGLFHHLSYSLSGGVGLHVLLAAAFGCAALTFSKHTKSMLLAFCTLFYYAVNCHFSQHFARYMMPAVPVLALFAAAGVEQIIQTVRAKRIRPAICSDQPLEVKRSPVVLVFLTLFLGVTAAPSVAGNTLFSADDTRIQAQQWFYRNVKPGTNIAVDNKFFSPQLHQTRSQLESKYDLMKNAGKDSPVRRKRIEWMIASSEARKNYNVHYFSEHLAAEPDPFVMNNPQLSPTGDAILASGIRYVVTNSISPNRYLLEELSRNPSKYRLIETFTAFKNSQDVAESDPYSTTAAPHQPGDLFMRKRLGPELKIYEVTG